MRCRCSARARRTFVVTAPFCTIAYARPVIGEGGSRRRPTDFAAIAKGAGIFSVRVEHFENVEQALRTAFAHDGPALVDVVTSKYELAMPPKIEIAHAKGFSLFMLRAILSGRGDEIVELARTNLR
ncbi:thiamine pyrophosphate-dependent enzyme [Burkholderia sp. 22313]|uniref:thiamine pyrophosphate-dependent enzyme n=1 Tax=Burkholderia sp. 22313 TaxID=3453908 RepID=UPI003F826902